MNENSREITVYIQSGTGQRFSVQVDPNCTVRELAKKVASSIFKSNQSLNLDSGFKLMFYGVDLTNKKFIDRPISGCHIEGNSAIQCIPSLGKDTINITFRELLGISKARHNNLQLSLLRIIVGIADLLLWAAAITTFLLYFLTTLSLSIAVPIVLTALFVTFAVLFFGWDKVLPKILPKAWLEKLDLGIDLNEENKNEIKETENYEKNNPEVENKGKGKEKNKDN